MSGVAELEPWPDGVLSQPCDARLRVVGTGELIHLAVHRWHEPVIAEEALLLERVISPVLDIGCGPGRHTTAMVRAGHTVLGIDTSPAAVRSARRKGMDVARVSVFGVVPRAGSWATALLLDGNVGIGGDPVRLLSRVRELLRPGGSALVEVDPPGIAYQRFRAQVQHAGRLGPDFPWARVGAEKIDDLAESSGFSAREIWREGSRWFADLRRPPG